MSNIGNQLILSATIGTSVALASCTSKQTETHQRELALEGAYNVRDLGGYKAAGGKTVKWNKVYRSGDLNLLTDADLKLLDAIPLQSTVDFRDSSEVAVAPDRKPSSLAHQYFLPISTGNIINFRSITSELAPTLLVEGNKHFVRDNMEQYRQFFALLSNQANTPLLFHCSAGKDRAGFGAALFLSSLGVDRKTVIEDYLLTNDLLKDKYASMVKAYPIMKPLMEARREYIQAAFDVIDNEYGGMDNYLTNQLGVDLPRMRELYTE